MIFSITVPVFLTSYVLAEVSEGEKKRRRTDRCCYLITSQVYCPLNDRDEKGGQFPASTALSSTCFSFLCFCLSSNSLFTCPPFSFRPVSVYPLFSCVVVDRVRVVHCVMALTAEHPNHIPTWNRLTDSPQHSIGCQRRAAQITTYCTAACNVCPPQQRARKGAYRLKRHGWVKAVTHPTDIQRSFIKMCVCLQA